MCIWIFKVSGRDISAYETLFTLFRLMTLTSSRSINMMDEFSFKSLSNASYKF